MNSSFSSEKIRPHPHYIYMYTCIHVLKLLAKLPFITLVLSIYRTLFVLLTTPPPAPLGVTGVRPT